MNTWIALLRGINVGGRHIVPMAELVHELQTLNLKDVRTYIQSGNVVFRTARRNPAALETAIAKAIEHRYGFRPRVVIFTKEHLERIVASNPFPKAEPKTLLVYFLASSPGAPDLAAMKTISSRKERFHLADEVLYLLVPDGIGTSKLAENAERLLGVAATARNWRTVQKLMELTADV